MIGRTVSHYRIEEKLGEGGMGVVYRARDLTLHRMAAVKFLPQEFATNDRRVRFEHEAQLASALNHPHIVSVYEAGVDRGELYLITEYVDGLTLAEWSVRERPSVRQIIELAIGIADALATAHQAGIIHRDVKPENILVARQGYAKLADFGLAKLVEPDAGSTSDSATRSSLATKIGVVMGTIPYMSPEQVTGKPIDARSDVFSFGAVLYELLARSRPFGGESDPQVLHAIVHTPVQPLDRARPDIPYELQLIVDKALEKDPNDRYQSMRELVIDLKRVHRSRSSGTTPILTTAAARRPARRAILLAWAAFAAASFTVIWLLVRTDLFWHNPLANARFTRFTDWEGSELDAAIAPDGRFVAFLSNRDGQYDVWVSQVQSGDTMNLSKGQFPDLLSDEIRNIGFSTEGQMWIRVNRTDSSGRVLGQGTRVVPVLGGAIRQFLDEGIEAVPSRDGTRIAYHKPEPGDPIFIADANGRDAKKIYAGTPGIHCHYLVWSPDARFIYFVQGVPPSEMDIWRVAANGGTAEQLTHHRSTVAYAAFIDERTLIYRADAEDGWGTWLYAMDVERRIPHRVSLGVEQYLSIAASADGRRLVATVANPTGGLWTVPVADRTVDESSASRLPLPTVIATAPRFGPDYVLYLSAKSGARGLWKFKEGAAAELWKPTEGAIVAPPAVSPDGRLLCFASRQGNRNRLYLMDADGGNLRSLSDSLEVRDSPSWSPDGKWIAVAVEDHLVKIPVDGGASVPLVAGIPRLPIWSPDGRFILYSESLQGPGYPVKAIAPDNTPFATPPLWVRRGGDRYRVMPDGKRVVFIAGEYGRQDFWMLDLQSGERRQLTNLQRGYAIKGFDLSSDGTRILFDRMRENSDVVVIDLPR